MKLRYGNDITRFTRDLDTARKGDLEEFISHLQKNLTQGWNGFTGIVIGRKPARPKDIPARYVMQPFEVKLFFNQKSWLTVPLEVGHNEIGDADEPECHISEDVVGLFTALEFPAPSPIALMPLHYQIAQKLHGVSEDGSTRAHDLIDLQIIVSESVIDYQTTRETCNRLFAYRNLHSWPPIVKKNVDWESLYESQIGNLPVVGSVDEAIVWVNDLVHAIEAAD